MLSMSPPAVGGYFPLELGTGRGLPWLPEAVRFQSARAAISAFFEVVKPKRVWVPNYVCQAMTDALMYSGVSIYRYPLATNRAVPVELDLEPFDWLICVDYFGMTAGSIEEAVTRFGAERILLDASQSLFTSVTSKVSAVFSPRKFVGLPDGGLLRSKVPIVASKQADEASSISRCSHLLTRLSGAVEEGYSSFIDAEVSLNDCTPAAMSNLTQRLLDSIDFAEVKERRIRNYQWLYQTLTKLGFRGEYLPDGYVPLCYPVFGVDASLVRRRLAEKRIYLPNYWPGIELPPEDIHALELRDCTVFLPCDQRYTIEDLKRVVVAIQEAWRL